jgi:general secretion pathway protein D
MRNAIWILLGCGMIVVQGAYGQTRQTIESDVTSSVPEGSVSLHELTAVVAKRTSKKIVLSPQVRANILLFGVKPENISYAEFQSILEVHGFAAVEVDGLVTVLPDANLRASPVPTVSGSKQYADSEVVTKVIKVKSIPVAMLLSTLRPLVAQMGHMAVIPCVNTLIIVDRYANVKRIASMIDSMDTGEPYKPAPCVPSEAK